MESVREQECALANLLYKRWLMSDQRVLVARALRLSFEANFALIIVHLMFVGREIGKFELFEFGEVAAVEI